MVNSISVLGSTGSIGTQTLDVAEKLHISVCALTAYSNIDLLEKQIRKFRPKLAVVFLEEQAQKLKERIKDTKTCVMSGMKGLISAAEIDSADIVLNALVGMVGLEPTLRAVESKKNIALANKETLVAGGSLVMNAVTKNGVHLYPVDSEHSAIFQCLQGRPDEKSLKKIILTASGGPFFGKTKSELENVTLAQALNHPNWSMGAKITIDSATMMNKGLEVIEAYWLFGVDADQIDVVVHRESIVHSMIMYRDNSVIAQLGLPDMRIPIQYALTYPGRFESPTGELDLSQVENLSFSKPDYDTFKCMSLCKKALEIGGTAPAIVNGANETANRLFREDRIKFLQIGDLVENALENVAVTKADTLAQVLQADKSAREFVLSAVK